MAIPTLPSDIIANILSRLQSKTLIRFKSVSKQWYSLINSTFFINLHISQTLISQNSPNFIVSQFSIFSVAISNKPNPNFHVIELDHPLKHLCKPDNYSNSPEINGSVNGVVCISLPNKSSAVLYNPSTKTHRFIPPFTPSPNTNPRFEVNSEGTTINVVLFGFGFDSVSGDYKLLRLIETRNMTTSLYREASVYSLRNDSWKCVSDPVMNGQSLYQNSMGVFVNGVLHFIGVDSNLIHNVHCFNLRNEIFSIFNLPKLDERFSMKTYVIQELGGCLSVMVNYQRVVPETEGDTTLAQADLWVMKEYRNEESWFRLFSINDPSKFGVLNFIRPIVYSRDKNRVLLELVGLAFGWYSWGSKRFERITVPSCLSLHKPCELWTFVDSLVSLEKDKEKGKDKSKAKILPKKSKNKDNFLSSGFKLRL